MILGIKFKAIVSASGGNRFACRQSSFSMFALFPISMQSQLSKALLNCTRVSKSSETVSKWMMF